MLRAVRPLCATLVLLFALPASPALARLQTMRGTETAYAHAMRAINPRLAEVQSRIYASTLLQSAQKMHVDPRLVMAIVTIESHWNVRAVSVDGAIGLGQLKPSTAHRLGVDAWSGRSNIIGLTRYMHRLLGMFKSSRSAIELALASYNAGPLAVAAHGNTPPAVTRPYVAKVVATYHAFAARLAAGFSAVRTTLADADSPMAVAHAQTTYWTR